MRCLFDMMDMLWLLPLGFIAGTIGSMVGLGGGIITVPVMTLAGYSPTLAVTVSLYAIFSNAAASTILYARRGLVEYKTGIFMAAIAIPGTALGAIASSWVKQDEFQVLFGILMITVAIYTATRQNIRGRAKVGTVSALVAAAASLGGRNGVELFWYRWRNHIRSSIGGSAWNGHVTCCSDLTVSLHSVHLQLR